MSNCILTQVYILFPFAFKGPIFIMDAEWKNKNERRETESAPTPISAVLKKKRPHFTEPRLWSFAPPRTTQVRDNGISFWGGAGESQRAAL